MFISISKNGNDDLEYVNDFCLHNQDLCKECDDKFRKVLLDNIIKVYGNNEVIDKIRNNKIDIYPISVDRDTIDTLLQIYKPLFSKFIRFIITTTLLREHKIIKDFNKGKLKYRLYMYFYKDLFIDVFRPSTIEEDILMFIVSKFKSILTPKFPSDDISKELYLYINILYNSNCNTCSGFMLTTLLEYLCAIDILYIDNDKRYFTLMHTYDDTMIKYFNDCIEKDNKSFLDLFTEFKYDIYDNHPFKRSYDDVYDGTDKYLNI